MKHFTAFACLAALLLAGCGGGDTTTSTMPNPVPTMGPATWFLQSGASSHNEALQGLRFYPSSITIDAGDSITWSFPSGEPHTVTFLGPRKAPPPPDDPSNPAPAGGSTYNGSKYTSSGYVLLGKTYTLKFPKPGVYPYLCLLHGGMEGTITVQPAGTAYPATQNAITSSGRAMAKSDLHDALASLAQFPYPPRQTQLGAGISPDMASHTASSSTVMRFLAGSAINDAHITVKAGTTVTWTNLSNNVPHTVTFGIVGQPFPNIPPFSPPSGGNTYDGTQVVNSGPMFPGQSFSLTLTKPGTYTYHCLFHDDTENMIGTITVK